MTDREIIEKFTSCQDWRELFGELVEIAEHHYRHSHEMKNECAEIISTLCHESGSYEKMIDGEEAHKRIMMVITSHCSRPETAPAADFHVMQLSSAVFHSFQ